MIDIAFFGAGFTAKPRRGLLRWMVMAGCLLSAAAPLSAQEKPLPRPARPPGKAPAPAPAAPGQAAPAPAPPALNLKLLLSNPVLGREEFKYLYLRRRWLVKQGGRIDAFDVLAREFAAKGAYFSAIELLWFAEKMTADAPKRAEYTNLMREWSAKAAVSERAADEAAQMAAAGKQQEALDRIYEVIKAAPYAEKAYYQLAKLHTQAYERSAAGSQQLLPVATREKVFRVIYESLNFTIAIDPIFYDAYLSLSNLREMFPDQPAFLVETQSMTERALRFKAEVIPPLEKIDNGGDVSTEALEKFAEGLDSAGVLDYAVFAYQLALHRGSSKPEVTERLNAILAKYFND